MATLIIRVLYQHCTGQLSISGLTSFPRPPTLVSTHFLFFLSNSSGPVVCSHTGVRRLSLSGPHTDRRGHLSEESRTGQEGWFSGDPYRSNSLVPAITALRSGSEHVNCSRPFSRYRTSSIRSDVLIAWLQFLARRSDPTVLRSSRPVSYMHTASGSECEARNVTFTAVLYHALLYHIEQFANVMWNDIGIWRLVCWVEFVIVP